MRNTVVDRINQVQTMMDMTMSMCMRSMMQMFILVRQCSVRSIS